MSDSSLTLYVSFAYVADENLRNVCKKLPQNSPTKMQSLWQHFPIHVYAKGTMYVRELMSETSHVVCEYPPLVGTIHMH